MPESPAAIPATCVPWNDEFGSVTSLPGAPEFGPGKTFATITFGVVDAVSPFGKPAGYEKPAGLKNGFVWSRPSSTMAILIPVPFAPSVCWITSAPMIDGERSSAIVYCTLGYTCVTYDWRISAGRRFAGRLIVSPSRMTRKRRPTCASGIARWSAATARACAWSTRARYARDAVLCTSSRRCAPALKSPRPVASASGGSRRSAMTRTSAEAPCFGSGIVPTRISGTVWSPKVRCTGTSAAEAGRAPRSAAQEARSGMARRNATKVPDTGTAGVGSRGWPEPSKESEP